MSEEKTKKVKQLIINEIMEEIQEEIYTGLLDEESVTKEQVDEIVHNVHSAVINSVVDAVEEQFSFEMSNDQREAMAEQFSTLIADETKKQLAEYDVPEERINKILPNLKQEIIEEVFEETTQ